MSESTTVARPYAKAVFAHAKVSQTFAIWASALQILAQAVQNEKLFGYVSNPDITLDEMVRVLSDLLSDDGFSSEKETMIQLITMLAQNKRISLFPFILERFNELRALEEKTLNVQVISAYPLTDKQSSHLQHALAQRFEREISLSTEIDTDIIGGLILSAGDMVLDGSIRGKLNKLRAELAA